MHIYSVTIIFAEIRGLAESRICKIEDWRWYMGSFRFSSRSTFDSASMSYFFSLLFNLVEVWFFTAAHHASFLHQNCLCSFSAVFLHCVLCLKHFLLLPKTSIDYLQNNMPSLIAKSGPVLRFPQVFRLFHRRLFSMPQFLSVDWVLNRRTQFIKKRLRKISSEEKFDKKRSSIWPQVGEITRGLPSLVVLNLKMRYRREAILEGLWIGLDPIGEFFGDSVNVIFTNPI